MIEYLHILPDRLLFGMPGCKHQWQRRRRLVNTPPDFMAAQFRHHHIQDSQPDRIIAVMGSILIKQA